MALSPDRAFHPSMSKQKSYATVTRVKHDNAVASVVPNIASERANCLSFTIPEGTKVSIPDVAQALEKLGDGVQCFVPLIEDGTIILQVVEDSENAKKLVHKMIEDGLPLKGITAMIAKLPQAAAGGERVAGRVQDFTPTTMGIAALKAHLEKFGDLITFRLNHHAGTRIYNRSADFLINISQSHKLPPSAFRVDNETWAEDVKITIVTRTKFCYFCRSTEHVRKECTEAPRCYHCGDRDHAPSRCRTRNKPVETVFDKSFSAYVHKGPYNWSNDDMPMDDFEVQREPALKGSITSIHAPGGALAAPEAQQKEMMDVVPGPSVQTTESGSLAVQKTSVPRSVSTDNVVQSRIATVVDLSGFQTVRGKSHKGSSSISSARERSGPYDRNPEELKRARRLSTSL